MVVMVEKEEVTGSLSRGAGSAAERLESSHGSVGAASPRFSGNKLYADYVKREGRPGTQGTTASAKERREVDDQFRDF